MKTNTQQTESPPRARKLSITPVVAELVSQVNCEAVVAIPAQQWSDRARASGMPYRRHGHLVVMRLQDALAAFGPEQPSPTPAPEASADPAAAVRDALGLRRRGER